MSKQGMNIKLNPGGLIGALALGCIAGFILFSTMSSGDARPARLSIAAVIFGALGGNFLWSLAFKPRHEHAENESSQRKTDAE
jgi:hypothetical protein